MNQIIISTKEAKKATIDELLQKLSSSETGLYDSEAKARLQQYGANEISEKRVSPVVKILSYFWGPIPWMIEIAAILSVIIRRWEIIWIISALLLNVMVRFWQEHKAENIIELLKQKLAPKARVLRNSKWMNLPALELVPGDIIRVRLGDIIPADIKLIDGDYLLADESTLTGESLPVEKHISDVAYSGSIVRQGEMNALVVATGKNSYFVKTAKLAKGVKTKSHFERAVIKSDITKLSLPSRWP